VSILLSTLKKILFWSYDRGSWQYDVMCVLILAFIFLGPNSIFHSHRSARADETYIGPRFISREEVGQVEPEKIEQVIQERLYKIFGHKVEIARIDRAVDSSGNVTGYNVWEK